MPDWRIHSLPNTMRVSKIGAERGEARYEFNVGVEAAPGDGFEVLERGEGITNQRVFGSVGPDRGADEVRFAGDLYGFSLDGPATVHVNGWEVDPDAIGPPGGGSQRLEITKRGQPNGLASYAVSVTGSVTTNDNFEDHVDGGTVRGRVGPERGTDKVTVTGAVTALYLEGEAGVFIDGNRVQRWRLNRLPNTLRISKLGVRNGLASYDVTARSEVAPGDGFEGTFSGRTAHGEVGPARGADELRFAGDLVDFRLDGPATVHLNGREVNTQRLG